MRSRTGSVLSQVDNQGETRVGQGETRVGQGEKTREEQDRVGVNTGLSFIIQVKAGDTQGERTREESWHVKSVSDRVHRL